jgi:hypothetical protein
MRLAEKIGKLQNGTALKSAHEHMNRLLLPRGSIRSLEPESLIRSIDAEGFAAIRRRHPSLEPSDGWPKYFDLARWIPMNLRRRRRSLLIASSSFSKTRRLPTAATSSASGTDSFSGCQVGRTGRRSTNSARSLATMDTMSNRSR